MSLKLVVLSSPRAHTCQQVAHRLIERAGKAETQQVGGAAFLVETDAEASDVRDWLAVHLAPEDTLLVVEFERWSSRGAGVDTAWLHRRGH